MEGKIAHIRAAEEHVPAVGVGIVFLRGTPPVAVVADIAEIAIGIAATARQSRKAEFVRTAARTSNNITIITILIFVPATDSLQLGSSTFAAVKARASRIYELAVGACCPLCLLC